MALTSKQKLKHKRALAVAKQIRYQKRRAAKGVCPRGACTRPRYQGVYCELHYLKILRAMRKKHNSIPPKHGLSNEDLDKRIEELQAL